MARARPDDYPGGGGGAAEPLAPMTVPPPVGEQAGGLAGGARDGGGGDDEDDDDDYSRGDGGMMEEDEEEEHGACPTSRAASPPQQPAGMAQGPGPPAAEQPGVQHGAAMPSWPPWPRGTRSEEEEDGSEEEEDMMEVDEEDEGGEEGMEADGEQEDEEEEEEERRVRSESTDSACASAPPRPSEEEGTEAGAEGAQTPPHQPSGGASVASSTDNESVASIGSTTTGSTTALPRPGRKYNQVVGAVVGRFTCFPCRLVKKPCDKRHPCSRCVKMDLECVMQTRGRGRPSTKPPAENEDAGSSEASIDSTPVKVPPEVMSFLEQPKEPVATRTRASTRKAQDIEEERKRVHHSSEPRSVHVELGPSRAELIRLAHDACVAAFKGLMHGGMVHVAKTALVRQVFQQHVDVNKEGCAGGGELLHLLDAYCPQMPPHAAVPPLRESGRGDGTRLRPRTSKRVMDAGDLGPLWSRDLLRTPDTCSMYLRLERPSQQDAGTTEWSPAELWCSTLMSHLFVTPAELRATASAMRTTLLHAPATLMSGSTVGSYFTSLTKAALFRHENSDRHAIVELRDRRKNRIRCVATIRQQCGADAWEWAIRFWPFYTMLNLGHMWTSLDGDERSLVPHAASTTQQQQEQQQQSAAAGSWVSGGVMRPRPSPRQLGMMMAAMQGNGRPESSSAEVQEEEFLGLLDGLAAPEDMVLDRNTPTHHHHHQHHHHAS